MVNGLDMIALIQGISAPDNVSCKVFTKRLNQVYIPSDFFNPEFLGIDGLLAKEVCLDPVVNSELKFLCLIYVKAVDL